MRHIVPIYTADLHLQRIEVNSNTGRETVIENFTKENQVVKGFSQNDIKKRQSLKLLSLTKKIKATKTLPQRSIITRLKSLDLLKQHGYGVFD